MAMDNISTNDLSANTNYALLQTIGSFIKQTRVNQNKTQQQIADDCGINRTTYIQIENGKGSSMLHFIQVLRALNALQKLNIFETNNQISPIALAKMQKNKRQRASKSNNK
jgi:transcriptional regulator with XRE-family HTH domain